MTEILKPINHIYKVKIKKIIFGPQCLDRTLLQGEKDDYTYVEADIPEEAIKEIKTWKSYFENWNKLPKEEKQNNSPFKLAESRIEQTLFGEYLMDITEKVLKCSHRFKNKKGDYTCGIPVHDLEDNPDKDDDFINLNGEFGMCYIEGFSPSDLEDCPYNIDSEEI